MLAENMKTLTEVLELHVYGDQSLHDDHLYSYQYRIGYIYMNMTLKWHIVIIQVLFTSPPTAHTAKIALPLHVLISI